jgi:hypothetical protein
MPRAAGTGTNYNFVLFNASSGRYDRDVSIALPSVTTIIGEVLAKPFLLPWYYRTTRDYIAGVVSVLAESEATDAEIVDTLSDGDMLEEYLADNRLRPMDTRDDAALVGTEHHEFLEHLAEAFNQDEEAAQRVAQRMLNNDNAQGHARAIAGWWLDTNPKVVESESVLYSLQHKFAGSCDLIWEDDKGRLVLMDLKNRKEGGGVYDSDRIQVGGYEVAWNEMHHGQTIDVTSILIARADGTWVYEEVTTPSDTFLHLREVYRILKGV